MSRPFSPAFIFLEDRITPAAFTVTNTDADGSGSLHSAITALNAGSDTTNTITFDAGARGTIRLASDLPTITKPVDIQGPGRDALTIDGDDAFVTFQFNDGGFGTIVASVSGLTVTKGSGSGVTNTENLTIRNMLLTDNRNVIGGGVTVVGGSLLIEDSEISANTSDIAAGIGSFMSNVEIVRTQIINNVEDSGGGDGAGGLFHDGGTLTVRDSVITGNVGTYGGGVRLAGGSMATIERTLIANNSATFDSAARGGGVYIENGTLTLRNATVAGNSAKNNGGGIRVEVGTLNLENSTVAFNTADSDDSGGGDGGGIFISGGTTVVMTSSLVAKNIAGTAVRAPDDIDGTVSNVSRNNLVGDSSGLSGISDMVNNNLIGLDAKLGTLGDNGGRTQTVALLSDSPAINKGADNGLSTDQRGGEFARVTGGQADIGAFEFGSAPPVVPPPGTTPPGTTPPGTTPPGTTPPGTTPPGTTPPGTTPPGTTPPGTTPPGTTPGVATGTPVLIGFEQFAVGSGSGRPATVSFYNADGGTRQTLAPFGDFTGGVRTASADFNGDGVADIVVGTGPGTITRVRVLDGVSGAELFSVQPFEDAFTSGVFVAAGDVNGDKVPDLVITPDEGGGPRVRVFSGKGFAQIADFFGIEDTAFRGGARAAVGDLNGDGVGDLLISAGFGGGPRVAAFSGTSVGGTPIKLFPDFFAFEEALRNGSYMTAGDLNGDGYAELIAGAGPGGGPRVSAFDGKSLATTGSGARSTDFFAGDPNERQGVRVAVKDLDGDDLADLVTGSATTGRVTSYAGKALTSGSPSSLAAFDAIPGSGGVFVG